MNRTLVALAAALATAFASPVAAANLTPDELTQATTASNGDLLLIYPTGGPMKSVQWSVVKGLIQTALGPVYLQVGNNLGDLASPASARNNLGLGTAATQNTGTAGANVPLLNGANTWSATQTLAAGSTTVAPLSFQPGSLLTSPVAGALEWDGANLDVTKATGPTREKLGYADGSNFAGLSTCATALTWAANTFGCNATPGVSTTGTPAAGALAKFSGASSITNGDLSGDCTTSGTLVVTCTKVNGNPIGTSGATIPLNNGANTFSGAVTHSAALSMSAATFTPDQTKGIVGTTTNNNAQAGSVGEYVSASVAVGGAVALATAVAANIASVSLTAGDWDCWGNVIENPIGSPAITDFLGWIGSSSASLPPLPNGGAIARLNAAQTAGLGGIMSVGTVRESLSATTTVFLSGQATFSGGTSLSLYGFIGCRRVR